MKILVKPGKDPLKSNYDGVTFLLRDIIPRITIYRYSKYIEGQPIEFQIKFLNMNDSQAKVLLTPITQEIEGDEDHMRKVTGTFELPQD